MYLKEISFSSCTRIGNPLKNTNMILEINY